MAAAFFLFLAAKKLPKKPPLPPPSISGTVGLAARAGVPPCGKALPVLGSTWTVFGGLYRSFTIAMACDERWSDIMIRSGVRDQGVVLNLRDDRSESLDGLY